MSDEVERQIPLVEVLPLSDAPTPLATVEKGGYTRDVATGYIVAKAKGMAKVGGRQKGAKNKASNGIRKFAAMLLLDRTYRRELRKRLNDHTIDPGIHRMLYHYAYGRPPEKIELTGKDGGPVDMKVQFYIPKNGRESS